MARTFSQSLRRAQLAGAVIRTYVYPFDGLPVVFAPRDPHHDPLPWLLWPGWAVITPEFANSDAARFTARQCYAEKQDGSEWPEKKIAKRDLECLAT